MCRDREVYSFRSGHCRSGRNVTATGLKEDCRRIAIANGLVEIRDVIRAFELAAYDKEMCPRGLRSHRGLEIPKKE